jgi:hypothetical protein
MQDKLPNLDIDDLKIKHCISSLDKVLDIFKFGMKDDPYVREAILIATLLHPIITAKNLTDKQRFEKVTMLAMKMVASSEKALGTKLQDISGDMIKKYGKPESKDESEKAGQQESNVP